MNRLSKFHIILNITNELLLKKQELNKTKGRYSKMKRIISLGLMMALLVTILCACGTKVMDVTIEGGTETATQAVQQYYESMSNMDFDALISVSASLNKTCVQNTTANFDEEKYNTGVETMKTELQKDMANVTITVAINEEEIFDSNSNEYKTLITEYKDICAGIEKVQNYAQVKTTLTYKEGNYDFVEDKDVSCIKIQEKWFVFDYSANTEETEEEKETKKQIVLIGGGTSVDDVVSKYFAAITQKNATNLADVLVTMNATAIQALGNDYDETQHKAALETMKGEMAADPDNATLSPIVSISNIYDQHSSGNS